MIDKYKYTTLSYSKNGLSCRPFHKEGFYREKSPVHTSFLQFLLSNEAKNAYRMPLGCLLDVSRMPPKCPLGEIYKQQNNLLRQTRLVMSPSTCGASRSQRKRICHTQPGKPLGIGTRSDREISKNSLQIRRTQFVLASLQPYIITTLHYYVFIFHFSLSAFRPFAVVKTTPPKSEARSDAEEDFRSSSAPRKWLEKFFKELNQICAANKKPPRYPFSDKY